MRNETPLDHMSHLSKVHKNKRLNFQEIYERTFGEKTSSLCKV